MLWCVYEYNWKAFSQRTSIFHIANNHLHFVTELDENSVHVA